MIGTRLGQYRIDSLLGQGGMGAVYLATDEMLGRQVAIKVLREHADIEGSATERFRSEAQILSRLDHPHILRLYGFSQHEDVLYMVTEFVKGDALQQRLDRSPVSTSQVVEWAAQVLDALDYAHQLGVVHRDIKPANILIDERERARLLDFGIARIVGVEGPTQTGHAVGTLTYMAPEQVLDEEIDGRADIYAFAVVLCQVLAGRRPYRATTTVGLIREIVDGPPPDVAALLPPRAAAFAPVLMRALARHPDDRTPTAGQMRLELLAAAAEADAPLPITAGHEVVPPVPPVPPLPAQTAPTKPPVRSGPVPLDFAPGGVVSTVGGPRTEAAPVVAEPLPIARRSSAGALVAVAAVVLLTGGALGWYLLGADRLVTPRVAQATEATPTTTAPAATAPAADSAAASSPTEPAPAAATSLESSAEPVGATPPASPVADPRTTSSSTRQAANAGRAPATPVPPPSPAEASEPPPAAPPVVEATPPPAPAVPARAVPATVEFKDMILMDRVDDEDEELDVTVRLDAKRVVVIDEDGVAKRSIAYDAIDRATYNTKKPGRFSFRRGASHWLTLEVGTTPIVLRLNSKTYEQVLTTLAGHGVNVERNP